jgi:hypothetical protein
MTREDREECWAEWKEAQELLRLRRDEYYAKIRASQIGRWRAWVEQNEEFIATLRSEIEHCEELERNACTEDFADRVRVRIEAKSQKILTWREGTESWSRKSPKPRAAWVIRKYSSVGGLM